MPRALKRKTRLSLRGPFVSNITNLVPRKLYLKPHSIYIYTYVLNTNEKKKKKKRYDVNFVKQTDLLLFIATAARCLYTRTYTKQT